jgi:fucose permease
MLVVRADPHDTTASRRPRLPRDPLLLAAVPIATPPAPVTREPSILDLNAGFVLAGMATTLLGPLVPLLARRWHLADATVATLFTTQYVCSTTVTLLSSSLAVRFGARRVITAGFALVAAGVLALGLLPWPLIVPATMLYGCGLGLVLPTTNFLVARLNPGREASAISFVNVSWAAGAVAWPVIVSVLAGPDSAARPLVVLAALLALIAARLAIARPVSHVARREPVPLETSGAAGRPRTPATIPPGALLALFAGLLMLYSGSEASIGGWVAEHVRRLNTAHWAAATTLFWSAISIGRLTTPLALSRFGERRVLVGGLVGAIAGTVTLALAPVAWVAFAAVVAAGLGLSPVFPITFGALTRDVAPTRPRLVGPLYACTGVGSALLPWLVGVGSTMTGTLRIGLLVPVAGTAGLLALSLLRLAIRR